MSELDAGLRLLLGELHKSRQILRHIEDRIAQFEASNLPPLLPATEQAMILSQYLGNYYTCLETVLLRIARQFENHLPAHKWHAAILENLSVEAVGLRPAVISDSSRENLAELLRFRHFTRYYFEFNYDWEKLLFLLKKFHAVRDSIHEELLTFEGFLHGLLAENRNGSKDD